MITTYFKNLIADNLWHTAGDAESAIPATYYVALSSTEPQEDGTGVTEPSGASNYNRQALGAMKVASDGTTSNANGIAWSRFEANQGTIGFWALYDAKTGGQMLMGGALDSEKHLDAGTTIAFEPGALVLSILGA